MGDTSAVRVVLLGTGPSERVPKITCLTRADTKCSVCRSALTPEGRKNHRRNLCALIQVPHVDGRQRNILVDCGKSFYDMAVEFFAKYDVASIDAIVLTHEHQDAAAGLDDMREWTRPDLHPTGLPVYLRQRDYDLITKQMPWLCGRATGSGFVPQLNFKVVADRPFNIEGIEFVPLECPHGWECSANGYLIGRHIAYITDAHEVPDHVIKQIQHCALLVLDMLWPDQLPDATAPYDYTRQAPPEGVTVYHRPKAHMSLPQSLEVAQRVKARHTILVGANHLCDYDVISRALGTYSEQHGLRVEMGYDGLELPPMPLVDGAPST